MSKVSKIIGQYFGQQQTEDMQRKFFNWFKSPIGTQEKENALFRLWNDIPVSADLSTEKSYQQVEKRLNLNPASQRYSFYKRMMRIAAIFLIPVLSILSAWLYINNPQMNEFTLVEHYVPNGEIREITLPDNSQVLVNSGSILFYQRDFKNKIREVYLSGEAKFTVCPDKKRPFVVRTNDMLVEVLGTVFNISSYPEDPATTTTLLEGKVGINIRSTDENYILYPSEQVIYDRKRGESIKCQASLDYVLAWEKGQIIFRSASLADILRELERRYNVHFYLNSANLKDEKLSVKFLYNETIEEILSALQQIIPGFQYKIEGDKIYIN